MNRPDPYVGITGFMTRGEVERILEAPLERTLMVGVLASSKTLSGKPNRWKNRYPRQENIRNLFWDNLALNLIHFNTDNPSELIAQLNHAYYVGGPWCDGFQLNMKWPNPQTIERWINSQHERRVKIVLQCGAGALAEVGNSPALMAERVCEYKGIADYVLIDPSGGLGKPFDPHFAIECMGELYSQKLSMNFGIAGGLSPATIWDLLGPVIKKFPNISWDAEGKLRDEEDHLNIAKSIAYIDESERLIKFYGR